MDPLAASQDVSVTPVAPVTLVTPVTVMERGGGKALVRVLSLVPLACLHVPRAHVGGDASCVRIQ